ncbi:flagellin N-terminal helical domain-containing protein [Paludibaculum fermentans]|uniref:Flagellin n=1 Tax=Paludibaculum fermentans TaxID=1473598 RepID=A0A7S7SMA0_PALFE|nr:flagellin [Paludibaculum fermentans]QOY88870.1 flagellin FliC [Paludibaculum fermentans]
MAISVQTNTGSLLALDNLRMNTDFQSRTIQRLTSGYRINASGDDAAGLAVANSYRTVVAELNQGIRNANDGLSQLQIVDGGLNNISKMVDRLRTLATQAASDTFVGDMSSLNDEFNAIKTEIDRQAANIGLTPEGPNARSSEVYVGGGNIQANSIVTLDLTDTSVVDATGLGINGDNLTNKAAAKAALTHLTNATTTLGVIQGQVGSSQNKLQYALNLASSQATNIAAADSRIRDADIAAEASNLTKAQVLQQSSMAALAQANSAPQSILTLLRQ